MERKPRIAPVAERIELLQAADRSVEHAFAALSLDIVLEIARHRGHHLHLMRAEEFRKVFLARLLQDGEVATVHHLGAELARRGHHAAEMRVEFGRAAGDVERGDTPALDEIEHDIGDVAGHFLRSRRPGIDVAMEARLVAAIADIDLQRIELGPAQRGKRNLVEQRQHVAHCAGLFQWQSQLATRRASASPRLKTQRDKMP